MPPVAKIEREQELYYLTMKEYLDRLRKLPKKQAVREAKRDLEEAGIIDRDGELTDRYSFSREHGKE